MRGINSKAVYARKLKTTLTLKAGSLVSFCYERKCCPVHRGFLKEVITPLPRREAFFCFRQKKKFLKYERAYSGASLKKGVRGVG